MWIPRTLLLALCLLPLSARGQARIHDPIVSLLAKPYGIEERIELRSIDAVHFGPDGSGRLVLTIRNSGVKRVRLKEPRFEIDVVGADGRRVVLGELRAEEILFPFTGGDRQVTRRHVVRFRPELSSTEVTRHLREASKGGRRVRLLGRAGLEVPRDNGDLFVREDLKFELGGRARLGEGFKPVWHRSRRRLPECGVVD